MKAARASLLHGAGLAACATLAACGGGGGGVVSTPPPVAVTPTPAPAPSPTPTPALTPAAVSSDTGEYRATVGAVNMNALSAYNAGATGAGTAIAIIDSGIDLQSAEFDNRISAASAAFGGSASVDDEGGHGTAVAFVAAGRRNGTGTHGVAFGATVIAQRVDRPGTCTDTSSDERGCSFPTGNITQAVDAARVAGARVINMSLGGSPMPQSLQAAIGRATAAGIVVVISAGNDGTDNPDVFTDVARTANARGQVIIAGSIGAGNALSGFSNKAGVGAQQYLTAVGERVRAPDENNVPYFWSGTSFAAPQISGAVALLAQAFPNMTGAQIVDLLFTTARDAGAAGTDPIYGRGIIDLTRAFQPVGATTVAGTAAARVLTTGNNGTTSTAMGDAIVRSAGVGAVILDGYGRAFAIDLAATLSRAASARPLEAGLRSNRRVTSFAAGGTAVSMTLAPMRGEQTMLGATRLSPADAQSARAIAGSVTQRLGARTSFALGINQGAGGLAVALAGAREPAFLVADPTAPGFDSAATGAVAVRHQLGAWGVTAAAEEGDVLSPRERLLPGARQWRRTPYNRMALSLDRRFGPLRLSTTATHLAEQGTLLGARLDAAFGSPGAASWFVDTGARFERSGWTLGGSLRRGWTEARVHGVAGGGRLTTTAWSVDVGRTGLFGGDSIGLRVAQPLRVEGGGLDLSLPTNYDYSTSSVTIWTPQHLSLAPQGRELNLEARYARPFAGGIMHTNLYLRRHPGNIATLGPDYGAALRWSRGF